MFARMCKGRSYNCIRHLCESFSYITLITLCENSLLPGGFRAACCDLLRLLYIDRYPQLRDCGRPGLPELLWVYEVVRVVERLVSGCERKNHLLILTSHLQTLIFDLLSRSSQPALHKGAQGR